MPQVVSIGLLGRKFSGKDSVANLIRDELGVHTKFVSLAFASKLKEICIDLYSFPDDSFFNDQEKKEKIYPYSTKSPRELMQHVGCDVMKKHFGDNIWIERIAREVEAVVEKYQNYDQIVLCFTDVRFENEVLFLQNSLNAHIVYVDSDERLGAVIDGHISESGILDVKKSCDPLYVLNNNRSYDLLIPEVCNLLQTLSIQ
jgi:hypothetical protein